MEGPYGFTGYESLPVWGGPSYGIGGNPPDTNFVGPDERVSGIPSLQPAIVLYPPPLVAAFWSTPEYLAWPEGPFQRDRYSFRVRAPVWATRDPEYFANRTAPQVGNRTYEFMGLRAPRINEGSGVPVPRAVTSP